MPPRSDAHPLLLLAALGGGLALAGCQYLIFVYAPLEASSNAAWSGPTNGAASRARNSAL